MSNAIGFANPSGAGASTLALEVVRLRSAEIAAARRMVVEHVPEEDEHRVLDMLGIRHG